MKNYLSKLKNISPFNIVLISLSVVFIICFFLTGKTSKFNGNERNICGNIIEYNIGLDKLTLKLKSYEKIIGYYYIKDNFINEYEFGDYICLKGKMVEPENNRLFNLFNYKNYLLSENIFYSFEIEKIYIIEKNKKIKYKIKNYINKRIEKCNKSYSYLKSFILGDSSYINENVMLNYRNIGISHLFAISGMHITFISGFLLSLLKLKIKNKKIQIIVLLLIMIFIVGIFDCSPSIGRAILLFVCLSIDKLFCLKQNSIRYLIMIFLVSLIINKYLIYNIGFLFSYIISFFLLLYQNKLKGIKSKIKNMLLVSIISFLASIPILINNFYCVNFLTPVFNLILIPVVSFILFPLSFICFLFPYFDILYSVLINLLEKIVDIFSSIKFLTFNFPVMPLFILILYYFLIIFMINSIFDKKYKCLVILFVVLFIQCNIGQFYNKDRLYIIDVGQGDSSLLVLDNNKNLLIDTGGNIYFNDKHKGISNKKLIPFFNSIGIKRIDYLILTHGDYDHMGEAINLVNNFKVEKVIFNCGKFNELELDLIKVLNKKKIPYYSCIKELNIDDNKLYFLNNKDYGNENDNSSVIYTELNNHKFLFMGDASVEVEEDLIKKYNLKNIDVLKVGHHGSKTSSSKSFVDETNPKYSIISVGKNNRYGHPNESVLENLSELKIYRTDKEGSIMFRIKRDNLEIKTCIS